jgi:integrase
MYPRRIPITSAIEKILMAVFPAKFNPHSLVFRASVDSIRNAFRRVRDRAGLTVNFHDLRHEAVSSLFEIGLTPIEVASISGHRTLKSLMRYSHADTQNLLKKMEGELA